MDDPKTIWLNRHVPDGGFLQSEAWAAFQRKVGRSAWRFEAPGCSANVIEHALRFIGRYGYVPRGPIIEFPISDTQFPIELGRLLTRAKARRLGWLRVEPADEKTLEAIRSVLPGASIAKAPHDVQPREVLIIDVSADETALLGRMKPKTRYNINLASRKGVTVRESDRRSDDIDAFCRLTRETAARDGIVPHPDGYYRAMLETLPPETCRLLVAEYQGEILAANILIVFGIFATYLHGASSTRLRHLMAPALLQWEGMRLAYRLGCTRYDLGGVRIRTAGLGKDWTGVTRFKQGFGPEAEPTAFPGSYDIVLDPSRYRLYRWGSRLRSLLQG